MITQDELVTYLKNVKVGELRELISTLEDELGVTAAPSVGPMPIETTVVEEQLEFDVILTGFTGKKVDVIKEVRAITGVGLRDAKNMVDNAPTVILEATSKSRAEEVAAQLTAKSGTVELR
jgi:large subunit ribosomal protein L7/L12